MNSSKCFAVQFGNFPCQFPVLGIGIAEGFEIVAFIYRIRYPPCDLQSFRFEKPDCRFKCFLIHN